MRKKTSNDSDISTKNQFSATEKVSAPDSWATIPEVAGQDYHANAKVVQRLIDHPKLRDKILGHITKNDHQDQVDDNTNYLNYCVDN